MPCTKRTGNNRIAHKAQNARHHRQTANLAKAPNKFMYFP